MAGTTIDFGNCAPAEVFIEIFNRHGTDVSNTQARLPMGLHKRDHIVAITEMPDIAVQWKDVYRKECSESDIDQMYKEFIPLQVECLPKYNQLIDGTVEVINKLQESGIKVGLTTGYNRKMTKVVVKEFTDAGVNVDTIVCAEDVPKGRPAPWIIFKCMKNLDVQTVKSAVKIGNTIPDILAGLNAGNKTIYIAKTGNMIGLSLPEIKNVPTLQLDEMLKESL